MPIESAPVYQNSVQMCVEGGGVSGGHMSVCIGRSDIKMACWWAGMSTMCSQEQEWTNMPKECINKSQISISKECIHRREMCISKGYV